MRTLRLAPILCLIGVGACATGESLDGAETVVEGGVVGSTDKTDGGAVGSQGGATSAGGNQSNGAGAPASGGNGSSSGGESNAGASGGDGSGASASSGGADNGGTGGASTVVPDGGYGDTTSSGGVPSSGGATSSGGKVGSGGGGVGNGGNTGTGGVIGSGGVLGTGGSTVGSGGVLGSGGDTGTECVTNQKKCDSDGLCWPPSPSHGCDLASSACTPCPSPPANGFEKCANLLCAFDCFSGFKKNAAGTACDAIGGTGGATGSGGATSSGGASSSGGSIGSGGAMGSGGSAPVCQAAQCGGCIPVVQKPCCKSDGSCGCNTLGHCG